MKNLKHFDYLLFLLILFLPGSNYLLPVDLGIINIDLFRVTLGLSVLILLGKRALTLQIGNFTKSLTFFIFIWIIYAGVTLLWSENYLLSIKDVFYLSIGLMLHLVLTSLAKNTNYNFKVFYAGWISAFVALLLLAIIEMTTGFHLTGNFSLKLMHFSSIHPVQFSAVATFDNPNNYSIYLTISVAMFVALFRSRYNVLSWILIVCAAVIVAHDHSRICLMALCLMALLLLLINYWPYNLLQWRSFMFISVVLAYFSIIIFSDTYLVKYPTGAETEEIDREEYVPTSEELAESSANTRKNLILNGWQFIKQSYGMGIGAGMYSHYIEEGKGKYFTANLRYPHNWPIEIASQYGLIIFLMFLAWGCWIFLFFVKKLPLIYENPTLAPYVVIGFFILISYVLVSNASSSFTRLPINWLSLSLAAIAADRLKQKQKAPPYL